jgi:hypothetical protein
MEAFIYRLEKNLQNYGDTNDGVGSNTFDSYIPISRVLISDVIYTIVKNDNELYIPKAPHFTHGGCMWTVLTQKFDKIEDVINFFSEIKNCFIGLYQIYSFRFMSPESFEPRDSIMVRYATDRFESPKAENINKFLDYISSKVEIEFIDEKEMIL